MATTTYTLTCLSPVHIGTGGQFSKFDGTYHDKQWHMIDLDRVLTSQVGANELAQAMNHRNFAWEVWLREHRIAPSDAAAYTLACPQDPAEVPIREAIKDAYGHPYFPGTSIKGAMRTVILWSLTRTQTSLQTFVRQYLTLCLHAQDLFARIEDRRAFDRADMHREILTQTLGLREEEARSYQQTLYRILNIREERLREPREWRNFQQRLGRLGRSREWLGQPVEQAVLRRDPHHDLRRSDPTHDLMRVVQVSDTQPVLIDCLALGMVWTYTLRGNRLVEKREQDSEYKIFVEWLMPETALRLDIRLDEFLFTDAANRDLQFRGPKEQTVRQLAQTCNDYARTIIMAEKAFYATYGPDAMQNFYHDLEATLTNLPDGAFLLNIGWGGGWEVKTVGDLLQTALGEDGFQQLRQRYRLGVAPRTNRLDFAMPFPKTRRIAYEAGAARWAMGWVQLEPQER